VCGRRQDERDDTFAINRRGTGCPFQALRAKLQSWGLAGSPSDGTPVQALRSTRFFEVIAHGRNSPSSQSLQQGSRSRGRGSHAHRDHSGSGPLARFNSKVRETTHRRTRCPMDWNDEISFRA
jgi:hypothetical protein